MFYYEKFYAAEFKNGTSLYKILELYLKRIFDNIIKINFDHFLGNFFAFALKISLLLINL